MVEVLPPLPQVRVLDLLEAGEELRDHHLERPFRVDALLPDDLDDVAGEILVLEHEQMGVDDKGVFPHLVVGYRLLDLAQLVRRRF